MGCGDACPVYPGKRYIDWNLPDPDGMSIEGVAEVRELIREHVQQLLAELVPQG
jgi:arsenate reductase